MLSRAKFGGRPMFYCRDQLIDCRGLAARLYLKVPNDAHLSRLGIPSLNFDIVEVSKTTSILTLTRSYNWKNHLCLYYF